MTPDASFGPFFFSGCYTRCGGFTVVWALVTARGGRGVLGKKIVVSNKNMLVSLHNNNKKEKRRNIPGTQDAVASRVPFAPEMVVVAFGHVVVVVVVLL